MIERLVPERGTCERMKELGFPQDTFLCWDIWTQVNRGGWLVRARDGFEAFDEYLAAPTLAEILEQLPGEKIFEPEGERQVRAGYLSMEKGAKYEVGYSSGTGFPLAFEAHPNPAEAAARLWVKVAEGGK